MLLLGAGEEIVDAEHVVAVGEQALAQVRAEKAGAAGDKGTPLSVAFHLTKLVFGECL